MKKINAIFFDLDDTLVDSRKAEKDASIEFKKFFQEFSNVDDDYFSDLWHKVAMEQYERYSKGEITYEKQKINRIKIFFSKFDIKKQDKEAEELFKKYLGLYEEKWKVFNDTITILNKLKKKYKLGIITNGDEKQQKNKLKLTKLMKYFNSINISGEIGFSKPNKEIFEIACKRINEKPENCMMIGDSFKLDIQGALNNGLNAIWINRKNEEFEFENQIKELKELIDIL